MPKRFQYFISRTKLNRPLSGRNLIQRSRLITLLDEGLQKRVTLMSAPAGFGKTTLTGQWLASRKELSAWLNLDQDDNNLEIFIRSLIAAVRPVVPKFGLNIERFLSMPKLPPPDYLTNAIVAEFATVGSSVIIVLDDYQFIFAHQVHNAIVTILKNLPENIHMAILTRMDPPWPLGLWRARSWIYEVRAADLRFSREETLAFFKHYSAHHLQTKIIDLLQERTEGWAAGLQLAQLSLAESQHPEQTAKNFSGSDRLIVDFLMDEVVNKSSPDILKFLSATALFDRFSAPLCDYMLAHELGERDSQEIIYSIERNNLFLIPLDKERLWYRYHHLFQNLLQNHHKTKLPQTHRTELFRLAAQWFMDRNLIEESIRYFILAEDIDAAANVLETQIHSVIEKDFSRRTLLRLLSFFPESAKCNQPALLVAHAYWKIFQWDIANLNQLLDEAAELLKSPECRIPTERRESLHGDIELLRGFSLFWQGDDEQALRFLTKARRSVPKEHEYAYFMIIMYTAGCLTIRGCCLKALNLLDKYFSKDCSNGCRNAGQLLMARLAIHLYSGDLDAVRSTAKQMLRLSETIHIPDYWLAYAPYFLGCVAYEQGQLESAAEYFSSVEPLRYCVSTRLYHDALLGSALVNQAKGETDRAWEYASFARVFALETGDSFSYTCSGSFDTRLSMLSGKKLAAPLENGSVIDSNRFWIEIPSLTKAAYSLRMAAPDDCNKVLQTITDGLRRAEKHHNRPQAIRFLTLKALAHDKSGCREEALQTLVEALNLAETHGFLRTFVDHGSSMADLLGAMKEKHPDNPYLSRLLDAFGTHGNIGETSGETLGELRQPEIETRSNSSITDELSNRELSVLLLLEKRLSNKEIAHHLFISPETVKKHTANLCRKLSAKGRRQAVEEARKNGLIPVK
ncbi:MAG: LuxR C-terminal-related transcriptional regulator [Geobacteraceae bacterium]|nr:LuxR C-terminal-related transcriptional regulator [Geobacteraceae bacterium]